MIKEEAIVTRISIHEEGRAGQIHVKAKTQEALDRAIDKLFLTYPERPYMSSLGTQYVDADGWINVGFRHWGAD